NMIKTAGVRRPRGGSKTSFRSRRFSSLFGIESAITIDAMKHKLLFAIWAGLLLALPGTAAERVATLPQTKPLEWEKCDLSSRLMDGAHRFIERQIAESVAKRSQFWSRDFSSPTAYVKSVQPNRARFQAIIGALDPRLAVRM